MATAFLADFSIGISGGATRVRSGRTPCKPRRSRNRDVSDTERKSSTVRSTPICRASLAVLSKITLLSVGGCREADLIFLLSSPKVDLLAPDATTAAGLPSRQTIRANAWASIALGSVPAESFGLTRATSIMSHGSSAPARSVNPSTPANRPVSRSVARTIWVRASRSHHCHRISDMPASARSSKTVGQSIPASARRSCKYVSLICDPAKR